MGVLLFTIGSRYTKNLVKTMVPRQGGSNNGRVCKTKVIILSVTNTNTSHESRRKRRRRNSGQGQKSRKRGKGRSLHVRTGSAEGAIWCWYVWMRVVANGGPDRYVTDILVLLIEEVVESSRARVGVLLLSTVGGIIQAPDFVLTPALVDTAAYFRSLGF